MSVTYKKFTKDVALIATVNILVIIKGIIFIPLITKLLGAFNFGIWTQFLITIGIVAQLVRLGLTHAIVRYVAAARNKDDAREGIYSTLSLIALLSIGVFLVFLALADPLAQFFQAPFALIILLPIIIFFESINMVLFTVFQALQKMFQYSLYMIITLLLEIIAVCLAVYFGLGLQGALWAMLLVKIFAFMALYITTYQMFGFAVPKFNLIKQYLSFSLPTLASNLSYMIVTSLDKYLIGFFLGTLLVGYYAPAYSLGNVITFFIIPISFVLFPAVSRSYDEQDMRAVKTKLRYSLKYFLLIATPAVFGISALSKSLLEIFTTPEIAQHAYFITPVVAASILFYGASDILSQILTLANKTKIVGMVWAGAAVLNIALNLFLIPWLGIFGAALATIIAYLAALLFIWHYAFKEFSFDIDWYAIAKITVCSGIMALLVWVIHPQGILMNIAAVTLGMGCYGILILLTRVFSKKEFYFLKDLLKRQSA